MLAVFVAALLVRAGITPGMLGAGVAAGIALGYGVAAAVGRTTWIVRGGFSSVIVDATLVSVLVAGTGGAGSPFFPLYLLAALGISRVRGNRKIVAGTIALCGGYLVASWMAVGEAGAVIIGLAPIVNGALLLIFCGVAAALSARMHRVRGRAEVMSSALEAERAHNVRLTEAISKFGPILSTMDLEGLLEWTVKTARDTVGAVYAHVATTDGLHRTAVEGNLNAYPSWWHPTIQRLVLYGNRTTEVQRTDEVICHIEGFLAVPLIMNDGAGLGSIVVGGSRFGEREQQTLELLATQVASALEAVNNAPGGRNALTGLPNRNSLYRLLRQSPLYETPLTILALHPDQLEQAPDSRSFTTEKTVLQAIGRYLKEVHRWAFYMEEGYFLVILRGTNRARARETALNLQHLAEKAAADHGVTSTSSVGLSFADTMEQGNLQASVEEAVLDALKQSASESDDIVVEDEKPVDREDAQLSSTASEIAFALVAVTEIHSPSLGEHLRAVSRLAHHIGTRMGLTGERLEATVIGALLHDLGKIEISNSILQKPGPLTLEEKRVVRQHPVTGARLLESIDALAKALPAVKYHHERFDGKGYPDGLSGEDIPLEARIAIVADAFDSMVRGRPYRYKLSPEIALQEIENNSGTQFDPAVVSALATVVGEDSSLVDFG